MTGFLLQRVEDGKYVLPTGQGHKDSYTRDVTKAAIFPTREAAERERCVENERIVDFDSLFQRGYSK
jgi:hypothetical protein